MEGITASDPDKGLNIRSGPSGASAVQFALPNGSVMAATGPCEKAANGIVWWAVEDGHWDGWASAAFLSAYVAGTSTCTQGVFDPVGKGTIETILGDYDRDGLVDALFLAYDGIVSDANPWTGSSATVQIQYADGGLSPELDITSSIADGGPSAGVPQMPAFPERIDLANTSASMAVLSSSYAGWATGAGEVHFVGEAGCDAFIHASIPVTPSAGNPQRPFVCDSGGGGRVQLYSLDGIDASFDYLVTEYDYQGGTLVPLPQITAGNASSDPDPTVC